MGRSRPRAWLPAAAALLLLTCACSCVLSQEAAAAAEAPAQMASQAGCKCLSNWHDAAGIERQGCANPDNDPMGDWCQVNPDTCLGYYGVYTSANGGDVFYDYCGAVRERTVGGCLCAPDWSMGPGATVGKPHYRDRCARPDAPDAKRKCRVDLATCPENSTVGEFDYCKDAAAAPGAAAAAAGEVIENGRSTTTFHECNCKDGWLYTYADGTKGNFSICANPDGDPMGPWCAVDPATCDRFAGEINGQDSNETLGYDYCNREFRHPEPNSCAAMLSEFDQCGGKSKCSDYGCQDEAWPGACCPQGTKCYRQDLFYYQCLSPPNVQLLQEQQAAAAAAGIAFTGLKLNGDAPAQSGADQPGSLPGSSNLTQDQSSNGKKEGKEGEAVNLDDQESTSPSPSEGFIESPNPAEATSAESDSSMKPSHDQTGGSNSLPDATLQPTRQPTKVYTKLKIDMDYDKLMESPDATERFKSDVAAWLKAAVSNQQYVQDAGVTAIVRGSVIALAYIEFTPDTPASEVDSAAKQFRTNADTLYSSSGLPSAWGGLVSYLVSSDAATLDAATMEVVAERQPESGKLGIGAIAGIAVALACGVVLSAFVVKRTLGAKRRRKLAGASASKLGHIPHQQLNEVKDLDLDGSEQGFADGGSPYSSHKRADCGSMHGSHGLPDGSIHRSLSLVEGSHTSHHSAGSSIHSSHHSAGSSIHSSSHSAGSSNPSGHGHPDSSIPSSHHSAGSSIHSSSYSAGSSIHSSSRPTDGSTYSSDSYGASPTKSQGASPSRFARLGQARAWTGWNRSRPAEEAAGLKEAHVGDEADPVSLQMPAVAAAQLSTAPVHGGAPASCAQAVVARAATPDAAFLPEEHCNTFDEEELDLNKNPVGLLRTIYGQGRNSGTGMPSGGGNRNDGGSYTGSVSSFHSISRPSSGAGVFGAALKQRRTSSASKDGSSS